MKIYKSLEELQAMLQTSDVSRESCPTLAERPDAPEVWSADRTRLLVGPDRFSLRIVSKSGYLGGRKKSEAKRLASQTNGRKGGRPRRANENH